MFFFDCFLNITREFHLKWTGQMTSNETSTDVKMRKKQNKTKDFHNSFAIYTFILLRIMRASKPFYNIWEVCWN